MLNNLVQLFSVVFSYNLPLYANGMYNPIPTAAQPDIPESAIASGCIDFILSPEDIAKEIKRITNAGKK